jgi:hypothetical protein
MTLSPSTSVRGVEGARAERNTRCSVPRCISLSQHGHHIWPRSALRGEPYEWVRLPDGRTINNVTGLCIRHHNEVTGGIGGHRARIEFVGGTFWWQDMKHPHNDGPLYPQPETGDKPEAVSPVPHPHRQLAEGETCPSCGYTKPRRTPSGPTRRVASWTVNVPDDAEQGAEILDALVEDFAAVLGLNTDRRSRRLLRYHVLVPVLLWASQHLPQLIEDLRESAGSNGKHP